MNDLQLRVLNWFLHGHRGMLGRYGPGRTGSYKVIKKREE